MTDASLEDLRVRALDGDRAALSSLCAALGARLFPLALRVLGDIRDAEDATQDILVKIVTHLAQFEGRSQLSTWAHTIAIRHLRGARASRAETRALDAETFAALLDQGIAFGAQSPAPTPEDRLLLDEVRLSCTQGMLLTLEREERLALVLVELLGFDAAEGAALCEDSHAAFRQRLSRARARLGTFLRAHCGVVNDDAACRCARQLPAKAALGTRRRLDLLVAGDLAPSRDRVALASDELRHARTVAAAFHHGGSLGAPEALRARIESLLPMLLGGA
jgi:RNA polymerase sigma factor (sigma-70 family)